MARDPLIFTIEVDKGGLLILVKAVDLFLERWPGGSPVEQESVRNMKMELHKALLEMSFLDGKEGSP